MCYTSTHKCVLTLFNNHLSMEAWLQKLAVLFYGLLTGSPFYITLEVSIQTKSLWLNEKKNTLKGSSPSEKNSPLVEHNLKTYIATSFQKRWFHRVAGRELTASSSRPSRLKRATMAAHLAWVRAESSLELRAGTGVVRLTTLMKYSVHATTLLRYKVSNQSFSLKNS